MASTWEAVKDFYVWALENGDSRTDPWLLVYSPVPVILIFAVYLLIVALGPRLMEGREPFTLRLVLLVYNLCLVGLSVYMFYEFLVTSALAGYSYFCQPVDYSNSELGLRMARVCWWFFFSKVIELLDTIFFIMRKKFTQISFLHVYHHATMIFNWWAGVKYVAGGQAFFIGMLNSFVHIFMYLYYGLAVLGPSVQKYLWWKRYLTMMQLTQFVAIAFHSGYNLFTDCPFPDGFNGAVFGYIISLIILFLNFYYQTYIRRSPKKKTL
ncbi:elongation of very long chain fatty acids protein 4-like [Rana temporaria]|uniref:elongation of very long chain fatty acids protein 4-like n=1 Tax=Rana temporaria TaxID=8407 RepID=UPI001AAD46BB|nr:elongation of very long chain fatty acids protein 4-like [Rana temporaria]XP_040211885.1 elongation of very long chain fatty acids protein 4-like [Rana temporaria]XP_040211886.1 elongation of very long chain fatty acids protein 4-like [Rana temporaria]